MSLVSLVGKNFYISYLIPYLEDARSRSLLLTLSKKDKEVCFQELPKCILPYKNMLQKGDTIACCKDLIFMLNTDLSNYLLKQLYDLEIIDLLICVNKEIEMETILFDLMLICSGKCNQVNMNMFFGNKTIISVEVLRSSITDLRTTFAFSSLFCCSLRNLKYIDLSGYLGRKMTDLEKEELLEVATKTTLKLPLYGETTIEYIERLKQPNVSD